MIPAAGHIAPALSVTLYRDQDPRVEIAEKITKRVLIVIRGDTPKQAMSRARKLVDALLLDQAQAMLVKPT